MTQFDVIVIGGGMAGISAAARLAAHASVLVLEMEPRLGYHSSGRSAAMFVKNYGNDTVRRLNALVEPFLMDPSEIGLTSLLSPRGVLTLAGPTEVDDLTRFVKADPDLVPLTPQEACSRVPILRPELIGGACLETSAQDLDADRMLQGFASVARKAGAEVRMKAPVSEITRQGANWTVTAGGDRFSARFVVNAAGAWADQIAAMAGVAPVGLVPKRRSAALLPAPDGQEIGTWPMVLPLHETWYVKPDAGKLLVSPADADAVEPMDAWVDDMVLAEGLHRFEQATTYEVTRVEHQWAGLRTFAPDKTPVVGIDPDAPGFVWLAGQGGYGIKHAPILSRIAADAILDRTGDIPNDLVAALHPARFRP